MRKSIKLALAATLLTMSANAMAMPPTVPDGYYDQMWNWVYVMLGNKRPCTSAGGICKG